MKGKVEILLGSTTRVYIPEDGEVKIGKGEVHSLKTLEGVECVFVTRMDPMVGAVSASCGLSFADLGGVGRG